jgi:DNA recombination protein RmuC
MSGGVTVNPFEIVITALLIISLLLLVLIYFKKSGASTAELQDEIDSLKDELREQENRARERELDQRAEVGRVVRENMASFTSVIGSSSKDMAALQHQQLETVDQHMQAKLDEMRALVDEKLQQTLNQRLGESFKLVNDRLEQVYKGLGEMQNLAQGVGDLKKVLSNVKTRGILGEIQCGAILEQILAPEQYDTNVATKQGSKDVVEFAVKLPANGGGFVYLPIDSKFPGETYGFLRDAYESGDQTAVDSCAKALLSTIKNEAKDIHDKYLDPPNTTDFAIMFLPFEGLYAEVVNRGMVEQLQRDFHVNIAGPSTLAALLNSLQMSFKAFAIQKRSGEVWQVLGAVKTEFDNFATALAATQSRINQAGDELDKLVGTRTRKMQLRLKSVTELTQEDAEEILQLQDEKEDK